MLLHGTEHSWKRTHFACCLKAFPIDIFRPIWDFLPNFLQTSADTRCLSISMRTHTQTHTHAHSCNDFHPMMMNGLATKNISSPPFLPVRYSTEHRDFLRNPFRSRIGLQRGFTSFSCIQKSWFSTKRLQTEHHNSKMVRSPRKFKAECTDESAAQRGTGSGTRWHCRAEERESERRPIRADPASSKLPPDNAADRRSMLGERRR